MLIRAPGRKSRDGTATDIAALAGGTRSVAQGSGHGHQPAHRKRCAVPAIPGRNNPGNRMTRIEKVADQYRRMLDKRQFADNRPRGSVPNGAAPRHAYPERITVLRAWATTTCFRWPATTARGRPYRSTCRTRPSGWPSPTMDNTRDGCRQDISGLPPLNPRDLEHSVKERRNDYWDTKKAD